MVSNAVKRHEACRAKRDFSSQRRRLQLPTSPHAKPQHKHCHNLESLSKHGVAFAIRHGEDSLRFIASRRQFILGCCRTTQSAVAVSIPQVALPGIARTAVPHQRKQEGEEDVVVGAALESEESIFATVASSAPRGRNHVEGLSQFTTTAARTEDLGDFRPTFDGCELTKCCHVDCF